MNERWILIVAVLAALKQTCDVTQELVRAYGVMEQQESDLRASRECESRSGTPLGILARGGYHELTCAVSKAATP
jgi:hypothetical protein